MPTHLVPEVFFDVTALLSLWYIGIGTEILGNVLTILLRMRYLTHRGFWNL